MDSSCCAFQLDRIIMSLRRKSCIPCFRGRRKCSLTYPACERCHYVYAPQSIPEDYAEATFPRGLDQLGELELVSGIPEWAWIFEQIRGYPLAFAHYKENMFVHGSSYCDSLPKSLQSVSCVLTRTNKSTLFGAVDSEISQLFAAPPDTLREDLTKLQAILLY